MLKNCLLTCFFIILYQAAWAEEAPLPVRILPLEKASLPTRIHAFGVLEKEPRLLYFETPGRLTKLHAAEGERVEQGDLLAELDTAVADNQQAQARQALQHANAKLARARKLKQNKVLAQDQLDDLKNNQVLRQLQVQRQEEERRKHFLQAPAAGILLQRFIDFVGTPVDTTTAIFALHNSERPWRVTAQLSVREIDAVALQDSAQVHFQGMPETAFSGEVVKLERHLNAPGLVEAEIDLMRSAPFFRAGLDATVDIETHRQDSGYPLPLSAFTRIKHKRAVLFLLHKDGKTAAKREVDFTRVRGTEALVSTDLSEFDYFISAGQHNLKDGSPVEILPDAQ